MSCCKCFIIGEACFRKILGPRLLSANLTFQDMESAWRVAHDLDLIPLIGVDCYEAFCARQSAETPTPADLALTEAIQEYATWAIYMRLLDQMPSVGVTPAGVTTTLPDDYIHVENNGRQELTATAAKYRNVYKKLFLDWLAAKAADYPCLPATVESCKPCAGPLYMNSISGLTQTHGTRN